MNNNGIVTWGSCRTPQKRVVWVQGRDERAAGQASSSLLRTKPLRRRAEVCLVTKRFKF